MLTPEVCLLFSVYSIAASQLDGVSSELTVTLLFENIGQGAAFSYFQAGTESLW